MIVISDTSPLSALILAGHGDLLQVIFRRVVIPPAVETELLRAHDVLPNWIEVIEPQQIPASVSQADLDPGETEAIALALELQPDTLLMDERLGRRLAIQHGLRVTGCLGLIVLAKQRGLITRVVPVIQDLQAKGDCWFGRELLNEVCASVDEEWT